MSDRHEHLLDRIRPLLESGDETALKELLSELRSSETAEIVELVDNDERRVIFDVLPGPDSARVFEKVDEATRGELYDLLTDQEISSLFLHLDPDDAVDVIAEIPEDERAAILRGIPARELAEIEELMGYSEDSAGGIMDPMVISVRENETVSEAIRQIRNSDVDEDFFFVFVVDKNDHYLGYVRVKLLLTRPESTRIGQLTERDTIYVRTDTDQEEVKNIFSKNDLIVVPVVDADNRLVGRITADRVIEVAEEEAAEDLYTMAGTDADELDKFSAIHAARIRMTWLLPCLVGTGITGVVLMLFHDVFDVEGLSLVYIVALPFVPMIAAISGNAGLQTSTIVVSGLATGHLVALKLSQVFSREVRIAMLVAVSCGLVGAIVCASLLAMKGQAHEVALARLVFAFMVAMFSAVMVATTLGLFLPFLFRKIGIDPAISSGPLITTANDSISVAIYMSLTLLLV